MSSRLRRRPALVPDDQRHVVHVERQRVAEQRSASASGWRSPCPGCGDRGGRAGTPCGRRPRRGGASSLHLLPAAAPRGRGPRSARRTRPPARARSSRSARRRSRRSSSSCADVGRGRSPSSAHHVQALAEQRRLLDAGQLLDRAPWPSSGRSQSTSSTSSCISSVFSVSGRARRRSARRGRSGPAGRSTRPRPCSAW